MNAAASRAHPGVTDTKRVARPNTSDSIARAYPPRQHPMNTTRQGTPAPATKSPHSPRPRHRPAACIPRTAALRTAHSLKHIAAAAPTTQ